MSRPRDNTPMRPEFHRQRHPPIARYACAWQNAVVGEKTVLPAFSGLRVPVFVCVLALPLAGCFGRDPIVSTSFAAPVGNWRVERQTDRITGAPLSSVILTTRDCSNSVVDFRQPAMLQVACFKDAPIVRFAFDFKIGSNVNSELGYRFDEKLGHEIKARFLQDFKTVVIEKPAEVAQFLGELETSALLYVRIRSLNMGRTAAEFRLEGGADAMKEALAGCRLPPALTPTPPPKRVS
jgi:hypothetical protein